MEPLRKPPSNAALAFYNMQWMLPGSHSSASHRRSPLLVLNRLATCLQLVHNKWCKAKELNLSTSLVFRYFKSTDNSPESPYIFIFRSLHSHLSPTCAACSTSQNSFVLPERGVPPHQLGRRPPASWSDTGPAIFAFIWLHSELHKSLKPGLSS